MRKITTSRSVLLNWTISYLLILLIPITIFIYGSVETVRTVRTEVSDANALILDNVKRDIDSQLSAMRTAFKFTYLNNLFTSLRQMSQLNKAYVRTTSELVVDLSAYVKAAQQDIGVTVYFLGKDYIVSDATANQAATLFYAQQFIGMQDTWETWQKTLSAHYTNTFLITSGLKIGYSGLCLTYCQTIRSVPDDINIFITIPLSSLAACCNSLDDRSVILAGSGGAVLHDFGKHPTITSLDLNRFSGDSVNGIDGQPYVCTYAKSNQADLYYVVITSESSYWSTLARLTYLFIAAISVALFMGIVAVWLLIRRNYRPLENITRLLRKNESQRNEFELINSSYTNLTNENQNMRRVLDQQTGQLREHYLLSLLKGRLATFSDVDLKAYYQIGNDNATFCLIALTVSAGSDLIMQQYNDEFEFESIQLFAADNVFSELMADLPYDKIEDGHILIYFLQLHNEHIAIWDRERLQRIRKLYEFFKTHLSVELTAVVSETTNSFERIRLLYRDVMDALEYQNILGKTGVLLTEDFKALSKNARTKVELLPQELADAVREGDYAVCEEIVAHIFNIYTQNTAVSFPVFRVSVITDLHAVMNAYDAVITDHDLRYKLMVKTVSLIAAEQADELKNNLLQLLHFACQTIQVQKKGSNNLLIEKIQIYIQQHYADSNLNISTIADIFDRNPRYLSQIFSQQTGEGLLDAINHVRIRHAIQLMQTTPWTLDDISAKTGFTNTRTFRRAFMRVTNLQPSKYMETHGTFLSEHKQP